MKSSVRLSYSAPGVLPPVFVVTSLSEQQWEVQELEHKQNADGQFEYWKDFEAEVGEHQYKLRLGPGDWWVLDESKKTVDDGAGNRNNLIVVEEPRKDSHISLPKAQHKLRLPQIVLSHHDPEVSFPNVDDEETREDIELPAESHSKPPLLSHEMSIEKSFDVEDDFDMDDEPSHYDFSKDDDVFYSETNQSGAPLFRHESIGTAPATHEIAPLMKHETFKSQDFWSSPKKSQASPKKSQVSPRKASNGFSPVNFGSNESGAPLMRHESIGSLPDHHEVAPLMRHESFDAHSPQSPRKQPSPKPIRTRSTGIDPFEKPEGLTLVVETLPDDQEGILRELERHSSREPEYTASQKSSTSTLSNLGSITEAEEQPSAPFYFNPAQMDAESFAAVLAAAAADRDGKLNMLRNQPSHGKHHHSKHHQGHRYQPSIPSIGVGPTEPLTPPMTPEMNDVVTAAQPDFAPKLPQIPQQPELEVEADEQKPVEVLLGNMPSESTEQTRETSVSVPTPSIERKSSIEMIVREHKAPPATLFSGFGHCMRGVGTWFTGLCGGTGRATGILAFVVGVAAAVYKVKCWGKAAA